MKKFLQNIVHLESYMLGACLSPFGLFVCVLPFICYILFLLLLCLLVFPFCDDVRCQLILELSLLVASRLGQKLNMQASDCLLAYIHCKELMNSGG
jgi:hypothetical protein